MFFQPFRLSLFLFVLPLSIPACSAPRGSSPTPALPPPSLEALLLPPGAARFPAWSPHAPGAEATRFLLQGKALSSPQALAAWKKLKGLGEKAGPALEKLLAEGPPQVQMTAATLLGCLSPKALPSLEEALDDPDPEVGAAAAYALGDLGDPAALPRLLLEVLPIPSPHAPVVRTAAASSLLELGSPQGIPFLLALLEAGLPKNGPKARAFHLPEKDRWALEKEIALRALRRLAGRSFGLEPEQGWEDLKKGAARWARWWREEGRTRAPRLSPAARRALETALTRVEAALPLLEGSARSRARAWREAARRALGGAR